MIFPTTRSLSTVIILAALQNQAMARELSSNSENIFDNLELSLLEEPPEKCCVVQKRSFFRRGSEELYCLGDEKLQYAYKLDNDDHQGLFGGRWGVSSIRCGSLVEARVCPGGAIEVRTGEDNQFECDTGDLGVEIGARESNHSVIVDWLRSWIVLEHHPWVAKGDAYLSFSREKKARILREKVNADPTIGPMNFLGFFAIDLKEVFDTWGDENDCRYKTTHGQGNVAEIEWVD